jgi:hypothetical protein
MAFYFILFFMYHGMQCTTMVKFRKYIVYITYVTIIEQNLLLPHEVVLAFVIIYFTRVLNVSSQISIECVLFMI